MRNLSLALGCVALAVESHAARVRMESSINSFERNSWEQMSRVSGEDVSILHVCQAVLSASH